MKDSGSESPGDKASQPPQREELRNRARGSLPLLAAPAIVIVLGYLAQPCLKLLGPPERCWEIQEVDGRLYKVNPCTGKFRLLGDAPETDAKR